MDDREILVQFLRSLGASEEELEVASASATLGGLALDLAIRARHGMRPFDDACAAAGLDLPTGAALWRALGFPDPGEFWTTLTAAETAALELLAHMHALLGDGATNQLARLVGGTTAQLAEAVVDGFRVEFEMPSLGGGAAYSEVVRSYAAIADAFFPRLVQLLGSALAAHMVSVARGMWAPDDARASVTRTLAVGFVDLVGYTESSAAMSPAALAASIGAFELRVGELVAGAGGRVVKLIGDEAMFVVGSGGAAASLAVELAESFDGAGDLPRVRVGVAAGPVVALHGDYYGDVVNLAARLVKLAAPSGAIASAAVAEACPATIAAEELAVRTIKGFPAGTAAFALRRA
jgi:class 3 adenylate cyclase